jgi:hypothetical protein
MMITSRTNILKYANAYDQEYKDTDKKVEIRMKLLLKRQRFLKKKELIEIGMWKSKRPVKHYRSKENDDFTVKEITKFAFDTKSEKARIESLLALKGISWPVASTILHFCFPEKYPIMDRRVIWALTGRKKPPSYNFDFWQKYCVEINKLSQKHGLPIRTVEKALWKYSKDHQKKRKA